MPEMVAGRMAAEEAAEAADDEFGIIAVFCLYIKSEFLSDLFFGIGWNLPRILNEVVMKKNHTGNLNQSYKKPDFIGVRLFGLTSW